jgi:cell division protein FtsW (lipid II flippase)
MKRSVAFPILAFIVVAISAAANYAVYSAGMEWFPQVPSFTVVLRNIIAVAMVLAIGWGVLQRKLRSAESLLLVAAALFGLGLAMQFRLGHDVPRQLSNDEVEHIYDSVGTAMSSAPQDSARRVARLVVARRNSSLRRDFEQARIDTRLARSLEDAYGSTKITQEVLDDRTVAPSDNPFFRFLPIVAALVAIIIFGRSVAPAMLSARWRLIGFYGSLGICVVTLLYLMSVGGVRGADYAPQELLKLSIPIAWAGLLIHYRGAFKTETRERFTKSPLVLWLYVLGLLTLPLGVFIIVRDFGQFLVIGIAQVLLLAYFTRSALYVVLFLAAMLASTVILLGGSFFAGESLLTALVIVVGAVVAIGALERFRRRDALWTSASMVLAGYVGLAWLAVKLPFVQRMLETPRQRFMLWADLYSRNGDPLWWDRSRQVIEALYAFDAGGIFGRGLGHGSPFLIPKASSDFIFAAFGEELGFVGAAMIVLAFVSLAVIGLRIARDLGRDSFGGLLVAGYVLLLSAQALIHITGTMNLLPMTGITLPLMSSGMSSLVVAWAMVGAIVGMATREEQGAEKIVIRKPEKATA